MAAWTVEQVLALAPDPASATAGRGLAHAAKWQSAGKDEELAWGEARGSGAKPYQTVVSLGDGASKCSCPSRKFPCKHAIGLLLRVAQSEIPNDDAPEWAADWQAKRGQRAAAKVEKAPSPTNPKTAEKRWQNVLQGLDECETFLQDAIGNGLLKMSSTRSWDQMAKRMVDAQAPGIAKRLRRIGERIGVGPDWGDEAAADLGSLGLLVQAARRLDALGDLAHDVRAAVGIPTRKEDLNPEAAIADLWDVLGATTEVDDRIVVHRTWLLGRSAGSWAMHLVFATAGVTPPRPLPGKAFATEAIFFPSAWPLRVHMEEFGLTPVPFHPLSGETWASILERYANALAHNPWVQAIPAQLSDATLGERDGQWFAVDSEAQGIPLVLAEDVRWNLLARTGNLPSTLFGEFDGRVFRVLSAYGAWGFFHP